MSEQANDRWLSTGAEVLIDEIEREPDAWHCEVLIVGSGYGGAVAAARLAGATPKAGGKAVKVYVLERGSEYLPGEFPATFAEIPGHVRFSRQDGKPSRGHPTGLFDLRLGKVSVVLGNGLGGGSLINAAVMEEATEDAFTDARWPRDLLRPGALKPHYDAARSMLEPEQMPDNVPKDMHSHSAGHHDLEQQHHRQERAPVTRAPSCGR